MPKTIAEGFDAFLNKLIPLSSEYGKATSHRTTVKGCLEKNFKCSSLLETGSFGNDTGIRHYSDTDYFAVCPANELWDRSGYTLTKFKEALQSTFTKTTGISVSCPAVRIPFGTYKSEDLEITPCYFNGLVETTLGKFGAYQIPDCNYGWMLSSPGAHNKYVKHHDDRLKSKLKPLIRFVKAWKYYNNVPIRSFYLELRITKLMESEASIIYEMDLRTIFKYLVDNDLPSIQDPMKISGYISPCSSQANKDEAISKLNTALARIDKVLENKEKGNIDTAFTYLDLLFAHNFPAR